MAAQLSRKRLEEISESSSTLITVAEAIVMARMLLGGMDSEPVAFVKSGYALCYFRPPQEYGLKIGDTLYAAPPAPVAVPDERAAFNAWNNEDNLPIAGVGAKNAAWLAWQARAAMLKAGPVKAATVPDGWTTSADANNALVMLDRINTVDCDDDERIESVKKIIRRLAAAPEQEV